MLISPSYCNVVPVANGYPPEMAAVGAVPSSRHLIACVSAEISAKFGNGYVAEAADAAEMTDETETAVEEVAEIG